MRTARSVLAAVIVVLASIASAAPAPEKQDEAAELPSPSDSAPRETTSTSRTFATVAAIIPGLLLHGYGHYVAGEKKTAYRIFKWQLAGLSMMLASGLALRLGGGSRYGNEITIPTFVAGSGLFVNTFLADIFGSASGGVDRIYLAPPRQRAELGYGYIYDPLFDYRHFVVSAATLTWGQTQLAPSLWLATNANNQRARLPLRRRWPLRHKGEYMQLQTAATYHNFGDDGFTNYVGEISGGVRLELSRLGKSLRGAFSSMSVGFGLHHVRYDVAGVNAETSGLLLGHYGFGFYLPGSGELEGYYQHRRDEFASGASPSPRNGSGFLGHFGLRLRQPLSDSFALRVQSELGAAWLISSTIEIGLGRQP